ncbi:hypothetical protein CoNPh26_CDS0136 [Staphylococcus phage S-CoN_Ph26]|nr:hypothetical protein CoNPh26_CDS0136 [Staphylococcus phage S-CoN_Ph26]
MVFKTVFSRLKTGQSKHGMVKKKGLIIKFG